MSKPATPAPAAEATEAPAAAAPTEAPAAAVPATDADYLAAATAAIATPAEPAAATPAATPAKAGEPAPAAAEKPKADDPWTKKWDDLTAAQRKQREETEATKAQLRAEREEMRREAEGLAALRKAKDSANPIEALQALGFNYEQATDQVLGKYKPKEPEKPAVDPELAQLRAKVEAMEARESDQTERAAIAEFRAEMLKLATAESDKYELVLKTNSVDDAMDRILSFAKAKGRLPGETREEAMRGVMDELEKHLETKYYPEAVLTASKVRSRLSPVAPKQAAARPQATTARSSPSSLTNTLAAAAPPRTAQDEPRTPEDFQAVAAALLNSER
jgi:hypothetical protein